MIECDAFFQALKNRGLSFFAGVPDSLLADFCAYLEDRGEPNRHVIAANEGGAIALAAGHYLATGRAGVVYMQNSGQGNAINPLISLADPRVYSIPMLLLIGWRGEPGHKDEPQHVKQGAITRALLYTLGIDHQLLPTDLDGATASLDAAERMMRDRSGPYAFVIQKGTFEPYEKRGTSESVYEMTREEAVVALAESVGAQDVIVSTTGKISRELFEYRASRGLENAGRDFLTVGSMGHASQIALGMALSNSARQVYCLDGDGALLMHMGSLAIVGQQSPTNFKHVVLNNGTHESVGGQPTAGLNIDIPAIAAASGYAFALRAESRVELLEHLERLKTDEGPGLLEVRVANGSRADLGRPTLSPIQNKENLMRFLNS